MFLFVENLAGLEIATHSPELRGRRLVKFVTPTVMNCAEPQFFECGRVVMLPAGALRFLKPLLSLMQLPVIQQDPLGWAFRLGVWKWVLSDGLLTELIVKRFGTKVGRFYSLASVRRCSARVVPGCAIVGSNWLEFGSMSRTAYQEHLRYLANNYPEGMYYCHPKEVSELPELIFGEHRVRRLDRPLEAELQSQGIPELIVGVCSSVLMSLAVAQASSIKIEVVCLEPAAFDGPKSDCLYQVKQPNGRQREISVSEIQDFLCAELDSLGLTVQIARQPVRLSTP